MYIHTYTHIYIYIYTHAYIYDINILFRPSTVYHMKLCNIVVYMCI